MGPTFKELQLLTSEFFAKHWDKCSNVEPPGWSAKWLFIGEVPHNTHKGLYAWLDEEEVKYVGLALNKGVTGYEGHSLGTRISKYWNMDRSAGKKDGHSIYKPTGQLTVHNITAIATLPFPAGEQEYLAAALEIYLIQHLQPAANFLHNQKARS